MTPETTTLASYLANIGTVLTSMVGWIGDFITVIMDNPVLLVGCTAGFAFTAIRLFKSLR